MLLYQPGARLPVAAPRAGQEHAASVSASGPIAAPSGCRTVGSPSPRCHSLEAIVGPPGSLPIGGKPPIERNDYGSFRRLTTAIATSAEP